VFRRQWIWFGKLISDEGFSLHYGNKSVNYEDERGVFQFGWEDGILFPVPRQIAGEPLVLNGEEIEQMIGRIVQGIESESHSVKVFGNA
jgi:hypothetical protein